MKDISYLTQIIMKTDINILHYHNVEFVEEYLITNYFFYKFYNTKN